MAEQQSHQGGEVTGLSDPPRTASGVANAFDTRMFQLGVTLPLMLAPDDPYTLIDAVGRVVLIVDVDVEYQDQQATDIATMVARAVNACAGYALQTEPLP